MQKRRPDMLSITWNVRFSYDHLFSLFISFMHFTNRGLHITVRKGEPMFFRLQLLPLVLSIHPRLTKIVSKFAAQPTRAMCHIVNQIPSGFGTIVTEPLWRNAPTFPSDLPKALMVVISKAISRANLPPHIHWQPR